MHLPGLVDAADVSQLLPTVIGATPVRMMRELADALEEFTRAHPVILSLEDLHWLDAASLELLTYVARRANPARILVLGTYRPADLILLKHPLKHTKHELLIHAQCQELQLECLNELAVVDYLQHRFTERTEEKAALHSLAHVIHQRTEGNPLFMVNLVDYFVSHDLIVQKEDEWAVKEGVACVTIPTGLREFIEVRVGQLDPEDRHLLAMASIAGMEFSAATIEAVLGQAMTDIDRHCDDLVRREQFIRHQGTTQWPDGTVTAQYEFQHALYQETLYEYLPLTQRMAWHRKIGERLEQGYEEHTRDIAAELALHFERGQDPDRASAYHQQAGEEAFKRSAYHEAILHLTTALKFLQTLSPGTDRDQRELPLQSLLGMQFLHAKSMGAPEAGQALARAHELSQQFPKNAELLPILFGLFRFYVTIGDSSKAFSLHDQIAHLAQQTAETETLLLSLVCQGAMAMFWGAPQRALRPLQQAISLEEGIDSINLLMKYGEEVKISCRNFLSWILWTLGFPDQATAQACEAFSQASTLTNSYMHTFTLFSKAMIHMMRGEQHHALVLVKDGFTLAQKHGYPQWESEGLRLRGILHTLQGNTSEAQSDQERSETLLESIGNHQRIPCTTALIIESMWQAGQYQEGLTMAQEALDRREDNGSWWYKAEWTRLKGELLLSLGKSYMDHSADEAEACFQEAIEISRKQDTKLFELRAIMSLSRLWQQQGKGQQARPKLKTIYDWFTEGFDTRDLQEAKALLEELK